MPVTTTIPAPSTQDHPFARRGTLHMMIQRIVPVVAGLVLAMAPSLYAGGGPENALLVVNSSRVDSLTIANHYVSLRQIPSSNVVYLNYTGSVDTITVSKFREQILKPIFEAIAKRKLGEQIDMIIYSSGFPYSVDFREDKPALDLPQDFVGIKGSLTGLTFLSEAVMARDPGYMYGATSTRSNFYNNNTTLGFRHAYRWEEAGRRTEGRGRRYYLSMMLGYTDGRGNTVAEVVSYLERATLADGTRPNGTVYLMQNDTEVRAKTRSPVFPRVAAALIDEGVTTRLLNGVLPDGQQDIIGAVLGRATLKLNEANIAILPGAIVENLTSFGGDLRAGGSQTPFTEILKFGAAGSSGTVVEPFAIQAKFPHPWIQVHYARGASLIEAFYQSLASPYQLLIAGDPLCRPWAKIPEVAVTGVSPGQTVSGMLNIVPRPASPVPVSEFRLFFDGRLITSCQPGEKFEVDTLKVADGHHELRVVAIEKSAVESQGRLLIPVTVDNHARTITATATPNISTVDESVRLNISSKNAHEIYVFHNRNPVGKIRGASGTVQVSPEVVGRGPVTLTAVAKRGKDRVFSRPVLVAIADDEPAAFGNQAVGLGNIPAQLQPPPSTLRQPLLPPATTQ